VNQTEIERVDRITQVVHDVLNGKAPEPIRTDGWENNEIRQLGELINQLVTELDLATRFASDLSKGALSTEGKSRLALCGCLKSLQASLRHLRWQTDQVAKGDFSQRVSLMGDFSVSFNWMIQKLDDHRQELKKEIAERREAQKAAEKSSRAKAAFLANMSHEIRTPMSGVLGMIDLLIHTRLDEEQRKFAALAYDSANTLLSLLNDILDFSKMEAGKLELELTDMDVSEELNRAMALFSFQAKSKGLILQAFPDPHIPHSLRGDPVRVRQILVNLIGNAVKFTTTGGITVHTTQLEARKEEMLVRFEVVDTGVGIEPAVREKIFDSFTQADASTTRKHGGTGLGLSISRQLVGLMGGSIGVESEPGKGSAFWFTIPFMRCRKDSEVVEECRPSGLMTSMQCGEGCPEGRLGGTDAAGRRPCRILLAEDNVVNQVVAMAMLNQAGCSTDIAKNGREAINAFFRSSYDVVLMDCHMPEMDGYEATVLIRDKERETGKAHVPIVALTANAMEGDREKCIAAGMDDYLTKPFDRNQLMTMLGRWTGAAVPRSPGKALSP
jgi:signal transduction histidine kinase/CheY-like chemotaxis protein